MNNVETVVEEPNYVKDAFEALPPTDFSATLNEEPPACGHPECADNDTNIRQSIQQAAEVVYRLLTSGAGSVRAIFYTNEGGALMFSGVEAQDEPDPAEVMETLLRSAKSGNQDVINVLKHAVALGIVELEQQIQVPGFPARGNASNN